MAISLFKMCKWVNGFWDQESHLRSLPHQRGLISMWGGKGGGGGGSRVQPVHAPGPPYVFHAFNTPSILSRRRRGTHGLLLMAALSTGFQLITGANLPEGPSSTCTCWCSLQRCFGGGSTHVPGWEEEGGRGGHPGGGREASESVHVVAASGHERRRR